MVVGQKRMLPLYERKGAADRDGAKMAFYGAVLQALICSQMEEGRFFAGSCQFSGQGRLVTFCRSTMPLKRQAGLHEGSAPVFQQSENPFRVQGGEVGAVQYPALPGRDAEGGTASRVTVGGKEGQGWAVHRGGHVQRAGVIAYAEQGTVEQPGQSGKVRPACQVQCLRNPGADDVCQWAVRRTADDDGLAAPRVESLCQRGKMEGRPAFRRAVWCGPGHEHGIGGGQVWASVLEKFRDGTGQGRESSRPELIGLPHERVHLAGLWIEMGQAGPSVLAGPNSAGADKMEIAGCPAGILEVKHHVHLSQDVADFQPVAQIGEGRPVIRGDGIEPRAARGQIMIGTGCQESDMVVGESMTDGGKGSKRLKEISQSTMTDDQYLLRHEAPGDRSGNQSFFSGG